MCKHGTYIKFEVYGNVIIDLEKNHINCMQSGLIIIFVH
jgi:hypothetical protein